MATSLAKKDHQAYAHDRCVPAAIVRVRDDLTKA